MQCPSWITTISFVHLFAWARRNQWIMGDQWLNSNWLILQQNTIAEVSNEWMEKSSEPLIPRDKGAKSPQAPLHMPLFWAIINSWCRDYFCTSASTPRWEVFPLSCWSPKSAVSGLARSRTEGCGGYWKLALCLGIASQTRNSGPNGAGNSVGFTDN